MAIYLAFFIAGDASDPEDGRNQLQAGFALVWRGLDWVMTLSLHFFPVRLRLTFCIDTEKFPLFNRCGSISKIKILLSLSQFL